ncbi:toxin [Pseudomonas sp. NPDC085632]|uniref:toxin n=1 Tax=Pseudomonas sp. NPDC085632 TaxID=3364429 RepID=UPI0037C9057D
MSTSTLPTFEEIRSDLNQIGHDLFKIETPLLSEQPPTAEQVYLKHLNGQLKNYREHFLQRSRVLYQALETSDLHSDEGKKLIATLKIRLNTQLINMDLRDLIDDKPARIFLKDDAGVTAIGHEARQAVKDRLLPPEAGVLVEKTALGPMLRPAMYALQFSYQGVTVELAGAFVVTEKDSHRVSDLLTDQSVGYVVLYTPARGLEYFDSLADLDSQLLDDFKHATGHDGFRRMLPTRYHNVGAAGIWPLQLSPIDSKPLFEHTYETLIDKRTQDIERALSFDDNPQRDASRLLMALDRAIAGALPDLTQRLELKAQTLFERHLRNSAPDWYRSASATKQTELAQLAGDYHQARQKLLDLMGPVVSLMALARQQWLERLSDDLEIDDLEPQNLQISTQRRVAGYGVFEHQRNLLELSLRGPHTGDELSGSEYLSYTTLTYNDAPLPESYADVTPAWLVEQALILQPRVDFNHLQKEMHARPAIRPAIEHMLDQRILALAYTAMLQGHLLESDLQLIRDLRSGSNSRLRGATLSLHGAQLQDLWVLRQSNSAGAITRVLLCTPQAPRERQFQAFTSELECQTHILSWASHSDDADSMAGYLISRAPMRFRQSLHKVLSGLSLKPEDHEHKKVTFESTGNHVVCLRAMADHVLATRLDDYDFSTPMWYRTTTVANRRKLSTLTEEAEGALQAFDKHKLADSRFPTFEAFLHEQAKKSLNQLLKRPANDVDPDTVWAYSPLSIVRSSTPAPLSYTRLFRDGYADGIGFLDEKFSRSARFKGPAGIDISNLTAQNVARSVTGVWIGERYTAKVKKDLQSPTSEGYDFRRNTTLAITQRQMKSAALECRLQGHIASSDLTWLEQSIDSMGDTSQQRQKNYPIHRLMIDGEWVLDNWLFSHEKNPPLLYTPGAPDGVGFREARLFNYLLKQQDGMVEYFTRRVGVASQSRVRDFLEDVKKNLPKDLNRTTPSPARYDSIHAVEPVSDLRQGLYNMKLQRKIDDVQATTTSRLEMISGLAWMCVEWFTAIATAPFPLLSLSTGLLLAFKDAMLALHAYRQGENTEAFRHFLGYLFNSAGAVLTDLRPALRSLNPFNRPLRLTAGRAGNEQARVMALVDQLEPDPLSSGMRPVVYSGQTLWASNQTDAIGRYLLYRRDPETGRFLSTTILAVPNSDGVMMRSGVSGGAPKFEPVPETPGPHKDYGMPPKYRDRIETAMNPQTREEILMRGQDYMGTSPQLTMIGVIEGLASTRKVYLERVEQLTQDARLHFVGWRSVPRAAVPAVEPATTFPQLIASDAFAGKNLVIGALPGSIASKQTLITFMDALVDSGFKRIYVEYLPGDVFPLKLEKFNKGKSWRHIKRHLKAVDKALGHGPDTPFSYVALVRTAREKGLKVNTLDASTSYQVEHALVMADVSPLTPRGNDIRNFYSHKTLAADIADAPEERWIALTDQTRMTTFDNTPGLADLHDAVAVRIEDLAPGQPARIGVDSPGHIGGDAAAKGDYHVALPTSYKARQPLPQLAETAGPSTGHFSDFDIPTSMRADIIQMRGARHSLDPRYRPPGQTQGQAYDAFIAKRERLEKAASDTFTDFTPPRAVTLPQIVDGSDFDVFLKQVADSRLNLLIGEGHAHVSSKAALKKYMQAFKEAGYETLYMEHLMTDLHQFELDVFYRTQRMPEGLNAFLLEQDRGHMPHYFGNDTYTEVVQAAAKYKVRIRALDCTASYHLKGVDDPRLSRNEMFSYFATRVIEADQLAHGPHKWVAFIGSAHTNYNLGVPGLAETLGAVSVHIRDTAPELASGIRRGVWEVTEAASIPASNSGIQALRADFLMEVAVPGTSRPRPIVSPDRSKLTQSGHFLIERPGTTEARLVHKSNSGDIVTTPIQVDDKGLFYIERWEKQDLRFKHLKSLIDMLKEEKNLTAVG